MTDQLSTMEFRSDDRVYTGFRRISNRRLVQPTEILIIAWFDGEPDLWVAENEAGVMELRRYYVDDWGGDREIPFDMFHPAGVSK